MPDRIDIREIATCTCLRLRRTTRRVTQIYDRLLEPSKLTINQFGLLAYLYGVSAAGKDGISIGDLAERLGLDSTTLNRNLKPLEAHGLIGSGIDPKDGRVRTVHITAGGRVRLSEALPHWRKAQGKVEEALGIQATLSLNGLLDVCAAKLSDR